MATSGQIGPDAKIRVDGKGEHDIGTLNWTVSRPKEPFAPVGSKTADRYTAGVKTITWDAEVQSRADGTFAIPWDEICEGNLTVPLVFQCSGRTERMLGVSVDEVGNSYASTDGKFAKKVSGKAFDHKYS